MRRKRRQPEHGEFQDPLKNYSGPDYQDSLERALLEARIADMKIEPFTALAPDLTIEQVMTRMVQLEIACVLIVEEGRLCGIFSERDVLTKVADRFDEIKDRPISEVMTVNPVYVHRTDSPAKALNLMADSGFRHVPILNVDDKVVGVLGPRRVTMFLHKHFDN